MKKIILFLLSILSIPYAKAANPELDKQLHELIDPKLKLYDILKKGADANSKSQNGVPAIIVATQIENIPAIELLLSFNADPNAKDPVGRTPLIIATNQENASLVNKLLSAPKIDVNVLDNNGRNALMQAASAGNIAIVGALLKAKANPNLKSKDGKTALSLAEFGKKSFPFPEAQKRYDTIIDILKKAGAK